MMRLAALIVVASLGFATALQATIFDAASKALSHRAAYDLELIEAEQGSGIADVRGRIVLEWADACDGFTLNQIFYMEISDADGDAVVSDRRVTTWESRDGQKYRFSSTDYLNGKINGRARGRAERQDDGGEARYKLPEKTEIALPQDVVFPTEHAFALVEAAAEGKRTVTKTVFDGGPDGKFYDVVAVISPISSSEDDKVVPDVPGADVLANLARWRVQMGYYPHDSQDAQPEYEFDYVLFENGLSTDLNLNYGDFAIRGALKTVSPLQNSGC